MIPQQYQNAKVLLEDELLSSYTWMSETRSETDHRRALPAMGIYNFLSIKLSASPCI